LSKFQLIEIVVLFLRASSSSQLQRDHFSNLLRVYLLSPSENTQYFCQLIAFLSNVAHHYRHELGGYEQKVLSLLEERNASLDPKLRLTLIKAVIQMRVHDVLLPHATLPLFFRLLGTQDKTVREVVQKHIMTDLRGINTGRRNEKTNKLLQNFLFTLLRESDEMTSACATEVVVHLYNQHIWTGAKTVNVLATAALSPSAKVASRALRFFLSDDKAANETEEERAKKIEELSERYDETHRLNNNYSKKTRNRVAKLEAAHAADCAQARAHDRRRHSAQCQFSGDSADRRPARLRRAHAAESAQSARDARHVRVLRMNLISRVICDCTRCFSTAFTRI
jgi:protein SDA1